MTTLAVYALGLVLAVALGARMDRLVRITHKRTQLLMSLIAGVLLGIAVLHLLPHAVYTIQHEKGASSIDYVAPFVVLGLLFMFFLQRLFHFHNHEYQAHDQQTDHAHESSITLGRAGFGVVLGLILHAIVDGIALASSMESDRVMGTAGLAGFSVFFAIALHKPLDALTLGFFMRERGVPNHLVWVYLLLYALICPLTVLGLRFALGGSDFLSAELIAAALAFSCGVFLCVALSDLLPEVHFHDHDRGKMGAMLTIGIALSLLVGFLEPEHRHGEHGGHHAHGDHRVTDDPDQSTSVHPGTLHEDHIDRGEALERAALDARGAEDSTNHNKADLHDHEHHH